MIALYGGALLPDIRANSSDGTVTPIDNLSVKVALDPESRLSDNVDWRVAANVSGTSTIDGWYYFDVIAPLDLYLLVLLLLTLLLYTRALFEPGILVKSPRWQYMNLLKNQTNKYNILLLNIKHFIFPGFNRGFLDISLYKLLYFNMLVFDLILKLYK
ncbi:MAG: hypothetical protein ACE5EE_09115 [Fidelibacterota bacterium]